MTKWLNAYLWGYKNWEAADHSLRKFKEFYPDGDIYIKVDANGDLVQISLTKKPNLVEKLVTNNYASDAGTNQIMVTLSRRKETRESFLYPGMGALADTIAYINMYKAPADTYTALEFDTARQKQLDTRGEVDILVKLEIKKTEAAREVNKFDIKEYIILNKNLKLYSEKSRIQVFNLVFLFFFKTKLKRL